MTLLDPKTRKSFETHPPPQTFDGIRARRISFRLYAVIEALNT
jgi:hypothetical protein